MTRIAHALDYSSPNFKSDGEKACQNEIIRFIRGIKGKRSIPVTTAQIIKWFRATPNDFVHRQILFLVSSGKIRINARSLSSGRKSNGVYVFTIAE